VDRRASRPFVLLLALMAGGATVGASTTQATPGWHLLARDRAAAPPGPPGLTAVTAEASAPAGPLTARRRALQIRVLARPASLRPYVSWHVACTTAHRSFVGDGFHGNSFTTTIPAGRDCAADVTAILYFWAGASSVSVSIYGR
jgi:hypothetical protein